MNFTHKNQTLSAVIIRTYLDVKDQAKAAFDQDGIEGEVKVRELYDRVEGPSQPGYPQYYAIFETYIDSGSVDYYYFAVPTYAEII